MRLYVLSISIKIISYIFLSSCELNVRRFDTFFMFVSCSKFFAMCVLCSSVFIVLWRLHRIYAFVFLIFLIHFFYHLFLIRIIPFSMSYCSANLFQLRNKYYPLRTKQYSNQYLHSINSLLLRNYHKLLIITVILKYLDCWIVCTFLFQLYFLLSVLSITTAISSMLFFWYPDIMCVFNCSSSQFMFCYVFVCFACMSSATSSSPWMPSAIYFSQCMLSAIQTRLKCFFFLIFDLKVI